MDRWAEINLFMNVADFGSVSRAARALDISTSAASRYLVALEDRLRVTNKFYLNSVTHITDTVARFTGLPVTYGVTVGYRF